MFTGPGFYHTMKQHMRRPKKPGCLADICDGQLYKDLAFGESDVFRITLVLNADGAPVFRSTSSSMWPALLMINELPFSQR